MTAVLRDHTDDMSFHQMNATWSVGARSRGGGKAEEWIHPYIWGMGSEGVGPEGRAFERLNDRVRGIP